MDKSLKIQYYAYHTMNFPLNFEALKKLCKENNTGFNDDKHIFIYNEIKKIEDEKSYKEIYNNSNKNGNIFRIIEKDEFKNKKIKESSEIILKINGKEKQYKYYLEKTIDLTIDGEKKMNYYENIKKLKQEINNLKELEKILKKNIKILIIKGEESKKNLIRLESLRNEKEKENNKKLDNKQNENMIINNNEFNNEKEALNVLNKNSFEKKMIINREHQIKIEYSKLLKKYNELKNTSGLIEKNKELMMENKNIIKEKESLTQKINCIINKAIMNYYEKESNYKKQIEDIQKRYEEKINNIFINLEDKMKKIYLEKIQQIFNENLLKFNKEHKIRLDNFNQHEENYKNIKDEFNNLISSNNFNHGIKCNKCNKNIMGIRYECSECQFNLCENCELKNYLYQTHPHKFYKIRRIKQKLISKNIIEDNIINYCETNI